MGALHWNAPRRLCWLGVPPALGSWTNPCGGTRWRTLDDGTIEVEGRGVLLPSGSGPHSYRAYVENSWRNFGPEIQAAAEKRGVPAAWILAIMATETGILSSSREAQLNSRNTCCSGPMAVMFTPYDNFKTFGGYGPEAQNDAFMNVDTGAAIIRHHMDQGHDLPAISALYNAGSLCCTNSPVVASKPGGRVQNEYNLCSADIAGVSYPEVTIMMNNVAGAAMGVSPVGPVTSMASMKKSGSAAAWLIGAGVLVAVVAKGLRWA